MWPIVFIKTSEYYALTVPFLSDEWKGACEAEPLLSPAVSASLALLSTLRSSLDECSPEFDDISLRKLQRKLVALLPFGQPDLQRLESLNAISDLQPSERIIASFEGVKVLSHQLLWLYKSFLHPLYV